MDSVTSARPRGRLRLGVALAATLGLGLGVATSSVFAGTDDTAPTTAAAEVQPGGNPTVGTGDVPAEGDPIKVMTIAPINSPSPPYPNIHEAARIYAEWLNDRGGINGRPLEVILCDGKGDPNEDANCGREAVSEGVVAVVGSFTFDASRLIPILEENNIAMFGSCCPIAAIEYSSPISFVTGSNFAVPAGAVSRMVDDGCEKPAVVYIETPAIDFAVEVAKSVFEYKGFDPDDAKFVTIPITAQDYSAQAAQAIDGTDCVYGGISDSNWAALLPAMQSLGATQRLYGHQGNLNGPIAEQFPEITQDGISVNAYPNIAGPMWDDYRAALDEYDAPDLDWNSLAGLGTWSAYEAFVTIVQGMDGEIDHDTFMDAANAATAVDTGGMLPVLDLSQKWDGMGGIYPSIYNRTVTFDRIDNGEMIATDDPPEDMTEALNTWTPDG
ncbi:MAG: ABC transporter substrate-binding protein [Desertimonas sp.]